MSENPLPICQKCRYYKVTWDLEQPHACLFFDFKSFVLPSLEVQRSTGIRCPQFRTKFCGTSRLLSPNLSESGGDNFESNLMEHLQMQKNLENAPEDLSDNELDQLKEFQDNTKRNFADSLGRILGKNGILG